MQPFSFILKIILSAGLATVVLTGCSSMPSDSSSGTPSSNTSGEAAFDVTRDLPRGGGY